jgi:hypothetical protein
MIERRWKLKIRVQIGFDLVTERGKKEGNEEDEESDIDFSTIIGIKIHNKKMIVLIKKLNLISFDLDGKKSIFTLQYGELFDYESYD